MFHSSSQLRLYNYFFIHSDYLAIDQWFMSLTLYELWRCMAIEVQLHQANAGMVRRQNPWPLFPSSLPPEILRGGHHPLIM